MSESLYCMEDSILDPFQQKKRKRTKMIIDTLKKLKEISLKTFIGKICVNSGIDKATVRKYLEELETADYIEIKDGIIKWKEQV